MRLLVTLGTDGNTDWVRTPDGQQFNLGSVSALVFVTKLALGGSRSAREALNGFLQGKEVVLRVDDDKMWELLAPRRSLWAADSFIPSDHCKQGTGVMTIDKDLAALEGHIQALTKAAATDVPAQKMAEGVDILARLAQKVLADQSDNSTYYGLSRSVYEAGTGPEPDVTDVAEVDAVKFAANDIYKTNSELATQILDQMEAVDGRIDNLVTAGKEFNSRQAKTDIHQVTRRIANITNDVDLTAPWVTDDLQKLAARAEYLHGLFFPKQ